MKPFSLKRQHVHIIFAASIVIYTILYLFSLCNEPKDLPHLLFKCLWAVLQIWKIHRRRVQHTHSITIIHSYTQARPCPSNLPCSAITPKPISSTLLFCFHHSADSNILTNYSSIDFSIFLVIAHRPPNSLASALSLFLVFSWDLGPMIPPPQCTRAPSRYMLLAVSTTLASSR